MKPFLPLSDKTRGEMETKYPFLKSVKDIVLGALVRDISAEKKRLIFQGLRLTETCMSAELSKLRSKRNRATKFSIYMKRVIAMLKLALDSLSDEEQLKAYPTLALICTHFVNIILSSSLLDTSLPKFVACHLYCFLKSIFCNDLEFVLDVLVCSNVLDDAESTDQSVGHYILAEVMLDGYLYSHDTPAFAKYLTILAFIHESTSGKDDVLRKTIADLDSQSAFLPQDVSSHLRSNFAMKLDKKKDTGRRMSWKEIICSIKPRTIACITRRQRLIVVSGKSKNNCKKKLNVEFQQLLISEATHSADSTYGGSGSSALFFMDRAGHSDNDQVSSSIDIKYDTDTYELVPSYTTTQAQHRPSVLDPYKLLPTWNNHEAEDAESKKSAVLLSPSRTIPNSAKSSSFGNNSIDTDSDGESCKDMLPKLSPRKNFDAASDSDSGSDDLEVLFEERATPRKHSIANSTGVPKMAVIYSSEDDDNCDAESRDFAPSESGEDDVPEYSSEDFGYRNSGDEDEQTMADRHVNNSPATMIKTEQHEVVSSVRDISENDSQLVDTPVADNAIDEANVLSSSSTFSLNSSTTLKRERKSNSITEFGDKTLNYNNELGNRISSSSPKVGIRLRSKDTDESSPKRKRSSFLNEKDDSREVSVSSSTRLRVRPVLNDTPSIQNSPIRGRPKSSAKKNTVTSMPDLILTKVPSPRRLRTRSGSVTPVKNEPAPRKIKGLDLSPLKEEVSPASSTGSTRGFRGRQSTSAAMTVTKLRTTKEKKSAPSSLKSGSLLRVNTIANRGRATKGTEAASNNVSVENQVVSLVALRPRRPQNKNDSPAPVLRTTRARAMKKAID